MDRRRHASEDERGAERRGRLAGVPVRRSALMLVAVALAGLALNLSSCVRTVRPPSGVQDPVTVHVAEYGKTATLVLPTDAALVEWAWGDWNYYALGRTGIWNGLAALFWSEASALGRRTVAPAEDTERLRQRLGASELISFEVERADAARLGRELEARFERGIETAVWNPLARRFFVREQARYWMVHNSTHELSDWLGTLGVDVRGVALLGEFAPAPGAPVTVVGAPDDRAAVWYLFD